MTCKICDDWKKSATELGFPVHCHVENYVGGKSPFNESLNSPGEIRFIDDDKPAYIWLPVACVLIMFFWMGVATGFFVWGIR